MCSYHLGDARRKRKRRGSGEKRVACKVIVSAAVHTDCSNVTEELGRKKNIARLVAGRKLRNATSVDAKNEKKKYKNKRESYSLI